MMDDSSRLEVQPHDVLCGKGKESFNHEGNTKFREVVASVTQAYTNCHTLDQKSLVVQSVIDQIHSLGGRFLRKHQVHGHWILMKTKAFLDKVTYAIRDSARKCIKRQNPSILPQPASSSQKILLPGRGNQTNEGVAHGDSKLSKRAAFFELSDMSTNAERINITDLGNDTATLTGNHIKTDDSILGFLKSRSFDEYNLTNEQGVFYGPLDKKLKGSVDAMDSFKTKDKEDDHVPVERDSHGYGLATRNLPRSMDQIESKEEPSTPQLEGTITVMHTSDARKQSANESKSDTDSSSHQFLRNANLALRQLKPRDTVDLHPNDDSPLSDFSEAARNDSSNLHR